MSIVIDPGYALSFNGVTDGVLVPSNQNVIHGKSDEGRKSLPAALHSFTLETWIMPDCGGIVYEYENMMRLTVGSPSSPAPATFEINLENVAAGTKSVHTISSAKPVNKINGDFAYWDGILFPQPALNMHNSYIATDAAVNDSTALNDGHRELLNVTVTFNRRYLSMHINGDLVVAKEFEENQQIVLSPSNMYLGGKGGEYRGTIEAIHLSRGEKKSGRSEFAPVKSDDTIGLWRFEEPIEPISLITTTPSISASTSASSSINIGVAAATALVNQFKNGVSVVVGNAINFTTQSPWSSQGSYKIKVHGATSSSDATIPKVPYNIIVNPLGYVSTTGKPTNKAPERLRLMAVDGDAGTITVESIHLDFASNASTGRRGALQAHDAGRFVVVTGDCLVDGGNGNVYQPQGSGTQFSHRQGQVCIDESNFENHGIMFSMSMAVDNTVHNKFAAFTTNPGAGFYLGHSGRHILNHVKSHPFMGYLPPASDLVVDKKLDASADVISASFSSQYSDIRGTVPLNSKISAFDSHEPVKLENTFYSTKVNTVVENGMSDISDTQRGLLAIGGTSFDPSAFALKALGADTVAENSKAQLVPSDESRIAILSVPSLASYDYAPFVQIHYNAICHNSVDFPTAAVSRIDSSFTSTATIIKLQSIKSFGKTGAVLPATSISIGGVVATTNPDITATLNHSDNKITFSANTDSGFQAVDTTGAIVKLAMDGPCLMVSKTLPDVSTIVTGSTSILDLIHTDMASADLDILSPGGIVEFKAPGMFPFKSGDLEGDTEEGTVAETTLDTTLCPDNYLPLASTDPPQTTPQGIAVSDSNLSTKSSQFSKIIIKTATYEDTLEETADIIRQSSQYDRQKTGVLVNNGSGYSATATSITVDAVDARTKFSTGQSLYKIDGTVLGTITSVAETAIGVSAGITASLVDNEELYNQSINIGTGTTNQSTSVHEIFDIIEHQMSGDIVTLTVQPSDRRRFTQLARLKIDEDSSNHLSVEYLMSRGRVLSFNEDDNGNSNLLAYGIISDIAGASVSAKGDGAPDSHIVKEIMPGAPVVTMMLGGPGQGAINTKETWEPSPTARLAWNTRRDCVTEVSAVDTSGRTVTTLPLNNRSTDLQSWGTYCFPKVGRIYLELPRTDVNEPIRFASAEYSSKTGVLFNFASGTTHLGSGKFVLADGSEAVGFAAWVSATGISTGHKLHVDDKFLEESMCNDGTTVNDRLFQTLDSVQHDYQLGTQYASTRALVEIPLFEEFFFDNPDKGIFPGPDNSMKIHVDATHTASNWAPNPVGRRHDEIATQDPEIFGAFSYSISSDSHRSGTKITAPFTDTSAPILIHVEDASIFPIPDAAPVTVAGVDGSARYRRAFLPSGEWVLYTARDTSANTITAASASTAGGNWAMSKNFVKEFAVGAQLTPAPGYQDMNYTPIADNPLLKSAGYEGRRSFYYDRSNVMTQGGNVDYGMRQYVSAVEFRAGPRVNPHLDRIQSGRAKGVVQAWASGAPTLLYMKDASLFPDNIAGVDDYSGYRYRLAWAPSDFSLTGCSYNNAKLITHSSSTLVAVGMAVSGDGIPVGATVEAVISNTTFDLSVATTGGSLSSKTLTITSNGVITHAHYNIKSDNLLTLTQRDDAFQPASGDEVTLVDMHASPTTIYPEVKEGVFLNKSWAYPYAPGGLRDGDTVWMNMHYTNPHAIEGLFAKSRGTLNEGEVWTGFNGGGGAFAANPRNSIPMENFLIGNSCTETAQNFVQHVNKTIELNYEALGLYAEFTVGGASYNNDPTITHTSSTAIVVGMGVSGSGIPDGATVATVTDATHFELSEATTGGSKSSQTLTFTSNTPAPTVAYLDPYQSTEEHARVLLYDVAHDREFIAFQDLWMQVQSSADATKIGAAPAHTAGAIVHDDGNSGSWIDVAAGFPSESKYLAPTNGSDFMEAAYSHKSTWNASTGTILSPHAPDVGTKYATNGAMPRTNDAVINSDDAILKHKQIDKDSREASTFFDTPDGTRAIPAFLALKGIRSSTSDLSGHEEARLNELDHWTQMDFVRRLTVDFGEVALRDGVTDIEAAAREVVRLVNQAGAKNGRTHARRPADQYLGESEKFDLSSPGVKAGGFSMGFDPSAAHINADFAATGSTHDPAPFWDIKRGFSSHDRGTHMGYVRAHLGRVVLDSDGNKGYSIVIHSTIPGAEGRNFCTWLDNSRAQTPYRPQYLIGHGGRFRNYWCQPDEMTGENMHPAPMPINRFGRPFAPITTLKEYLPPEETLASFSNNLSIGPEIVIGSTQSADTFRENASGRNSNTVIDESFETKSPSSTLVDGLRTGTSAKSRINFGGMTQAGIPGWSPDAGKWGMGRDGEDSRYQSVYGNASNAATAMLNSTIYDTDNKVGYIPKDDMKPRNIGDGNIYGIRLVDHRGDNHTVRMIYKQYGKSFANDLTIVPPTIDEEIVIHFDDRDVAQGGFTIGKHMVGTGEVCGEKSGGTAKPYKGNLWNNYPSPAVGIHVTGNKATDTGVTMDVTFTAPYSTGDTLTHPDVLGYLGFPESGVLQLTDDAGTSGDQGITIHYTSRSHYDHDGDTGASNKHYFYGCTGGRALTTNEGMLISPRINFTSVLTDEVIAAAVEFAMAMPDPTDDSIAATSFDCTGMFAPDGKTLGEWGVSPTAIRVKASSKSKTPLSKLFQVSRNKDWGLVEGASSDAVVSSKHTGGLSDVERDAGTRLDVGYIPETVLHITTRYKGTNANTATPILVDNQNNPVDISTWQRNLRGDNYTSVAGDHIIPKVDSPMILKTTDDGTLITTASSTYLYSICVPGSDHAQAWGERFTIWWGSEEYAEVASTPGAAVETKLTYGAGTGVSANFASFCHDSDDEVLMRNGDVKNGMKTDGIRRAGSKMSSPFLYFRGGRDSPDHWVPLYFGGGFSGVVMDINDGTQNDYGDFYTHPYAGGPTGSAGLQNVGEIAGSYALLDTNAMLAMFPGTPYLDDHKGKNNPPLFNQDSLLPFDMAKGANTKFTGLTYTDGSNAVHANLPSPIVLRFAHPHARYSATGNTADQTIYMVFGPGQAFPHNSAAFEPQGANIVTSGNGYSAVPIYTDGSTVSLETFLPNSLTNGDSTVAGLINHASGAVIGHLPRTTFFQINKLSAFNYDMNWEPTKGFPSVAVSGSTTFAQTYDRAFYYEGSPFTFGVALPPSAHPFSHIFTDSNGNALETSYHPATKKSSVIWHMDGGYHPGGHFLDNHVNINPKHAVEGGRLATGSTNKHNVSAFRPCGLLAKAYLTQYGGSPDNQANDDNVVLIDATRVQNAEELGAVISASINTFPGKDPLKAIGGTFLPSMQNAHKQDRYGWVQLDIASFEPANKLVVTNNASLETLPKYGWVRISDGNTAGYAPYTDITTTATLTVAAQGDPHGMTEKQKVTITAADGTVRIYVLTDTNAGGVATGTVLVSNSDTGAGTAGDSLTGGIAVGINFTSAIQHDYLEQIKTAIEHANGHAGKITVTETSTSIFTLTNAVAGISGNTTITEDVANLTIAGFNGNTGSIFLGRSVNSTVPSVINIVVPGAGYSAATVSTSGGSGTGLTLALTVGGSGEITGVSIATAGSGYQAGDLITAVGGDGAGRIDVAGCAKSTSFINPTNDREVTATSGFKAYVWAKSGTHRLNNDNTVTTRDHITQVHYNGLIDAIDRTKPVGAVGWAGEAYSYMNSYTGTQVGSGVYPAGLGAWHPSLGFNPYGAAETCLAASSPVGTGDTATATFSDYCVNGLSSRHLIAITHESELPLIAKADRDGVTCAGDWLMTKETSNIINAGTIQWDTSKVHNKSRYLGPATGGPRVEAQVHSDFVRPTVAGDYPATSAAVAANKWHDTIASGKMVQANACLNPTGDLFWDESVVKGSNFHEDFGTYGKECIGVSGSDDYLNPGASSTAMPHNGLFGYYNTRSAARNFSAEHVVWKRMDGGSLTMPAANARGLGAIPWVRRKASTGQYLLEGEKVLGNVRFSFESTNAAMFPIIQAQELSHPQLAEQHPMEIRNALMLPNEEKQFQSMMVIDDTGQEHRLEGGSPLGTVIMDFRHVSDREIEGLAPALAGTGVSPNMKIRLPNPDEIPGNIIVRPGFDRIQAYQSETIGSGGLQHPSQPVQHITDMFDNKYSGPRLWPTWENNGWEHLSQDGVDVSLTKSDNRLKFPASTVEGWQDHTSNSPLKTAYEPHDRNLYFHVTRMGVSMTNRETSQLLTFQSYSGTEINVNATPEASVWTDSSELSGGRYFLRVYNETTNEGVLASYTGVGSGKFTGVVYSPDFANFIADTEAEGHILKVVPSYYMPAGSTRFFGARRLRDHSEYSGASPDMKIIDWYTLYAALPANTGATTNPSIPYNHIMTPKMTPMPIPRMGHHYISPTMALMPGHYAHPAYQRLYELNQSCRTSNNAPLIDSLIGTNEGTRTSTTATSTTHESGRDPYIYFSGPTAAFSPSDIHGGAFTLLTETKIKYEGYGVAASLGAAGTTNAAGGHELVLEAGGTYTLNNHFPDPMEVGAYQIVIQPNVFAQQIKGFHLNHSTENKAPSESGTKVVELTGQQVNTVIAIEQDVDTNGAYSLILADAIMADVRGCEVIINEVILDIEPDSGSHFTNLPTLALYNPLGVQETSSPSLTRRSLPYRPGMFSSATPGYTLTVPWWGILHKDGAGASGADKFRHLEWHKPDNYYELCRASYGCVGAQLTLGGYPTSFLDIYEVHKRNRSLNPTCVVISNNGSSTITVDDNSLFPVVPYYGEKLEYTKDGVRYTATYGNRTGTLAYATLGASVTFSTVSGSGEFWANIATGTIIKLTRPYDNHSSDKVFTDSLSSIITRALPQISNGSRDTNSLHVPDAYLCMWHPNLGRPFTWYSDTADGGTRNFYTKAGAADTPLDKKPYNMLPEHFETIHYQDFNYVASKGPFGFAMSWIAPPGGGTSPTNAADGIVHTAAVIDLDTNLKHQGGVESSTESSGVLINHPSGASNTYSVNTTSAIPVDAVDPTTKFQVGDSVYNSAGILVGVLTAVDGSAPYGVTFGGGTLVVLTNNEALYLSEKYNFAGFWPGGSHGGGAVSRLEAYGDSLIGWGGETYGMDCGTFDDNTGIRTRTYNEATVASPYARNHCFGYRFGVRQAYNRPRWGQYVRGWLEVANSNALLGYYHGPLIQQDNKTNGWDYVGSDTALGDVSFTASYVGILERLTQVSALLNQDQIGRQVRYSDGRRMTQPFGCAVRTIRNASTVRREYPGDNAGKDISELANAHRYYMVDWWGNTRGEDVRRFPVRGFGIRPAWDPEDAYTDTNIAHRPAANALFGGDGNDRQSGNANTANNDASNMGVADWFNPASALRVGDRGDGRGVRWPTVFNESMLMDVSETHEATGLVLSHSTAEPAFGQGLVRPSNLALQSGEIERGISARLDVASEDGLLKPSASVAEGTETITADTRLAEPVGRDDVRIGLDVDTIGELNEGVSREYVIMSTEAVSLHTDREIGQRTTVRGAMDGASRTLTDFDLTALNFSSNPKAGITRISNAHAYWPLGGTYAMEWSRYAGVLDVKGWGQAGASSSSNPYQNAAHDSTLQNTNATDSTIDFLYRPAQVLDNKHVQLFRPAPVISADDTDGDDTIQGGSNFYRATAGGKYGLFTSDAPGALTGTPSSPPYAPVYSITPTSSTTVPTSQGPKIQGVDVTGYNKADIRSPVARVVMTENTLEHFRADASRKSPDDEEGDFNVQPRYSQTLHPKGSDGDASYNTGDHSGE